MDVNIGTGEELLGGKKNTAYLNLGVADALGTDYFFLREQLTDQQLDYLTRTRDFVDREVLPVINGYWERAEFPWPLVKRLGQLGIVGDGITGYGCPPMDPVSVGLINMELSRGDGSLATFLGVQAGLAMRSIALLGSEEQKQRWLPPMARLEAIGAFALTGALTITYARPVQRLRNPPSHRRGFRGCDRWGFR